MIYIYFIFRNRYVFIIAKRELVINSNSIWYYSPPTQLIYPNYYPTIMFD